MTIRQIIEQEDLESAAFAAEYHGKPALTDAQLARLDFLSSLEADQLRADRAAFQSDAGPAL